MVLNYQISNVLVVDVDYKTNNASVNEQPLIG